VAHVVAVQLITGTADTRSRSVCRRPWHKGREIMSGADRASRRSASRRSMSCPRCRGSMDEVLSIAPNASNPGVVAYECPHCRYVTSVLLQPSERTSDRRKLSK
jgi:hypothetical protein